MPILSAFSGTKDYSIPYDVTYVSITTEGGGGSMIQNCGIRAFYLYDLGVFCMPKLSAYKNMKIFKKYIYF